MRPDAAIIAIVLMSAAVVQAQSVVLTRFIDHGSDRVATHTVAPDYPRVARRDRIEGEVKVCYNIDRKGRPYRVAVRNSTHRIFERPALRAVKASSYLPLKKDEKPSGIKSCRTFRFELTPAVAENAD